MLEKRAINKFGKHYLLGINEDNEYVWLEKETWECDWYWAAGYLHTYTNNLNPEMAKDLTMHTHFDYMFSRGPQCSRDMFKMYFKDTVLTDEEIWVLCDLMMTYYTLKKTAELFRYGYSHQTALAKIDKLQSPMTADMINKVLLPEVFKKIEQLLAP